MGLHVISFQTYNVYLHVYTLYTMCDKGPTYTCISTCTFALLTTPTCSWAVGVQRRLDMSPWSCDRLKTLESSLDVDSLHISSSLTSFETARQVLLTIEIVERIQHV